MNSFGNINGFIAHVVEVKGAFIKVNILGAISDFIPLLQGYNSFKTSYTPPQIGQQVLVLRLENFTIALGDIPNNQSLENINTQEDSIVYSDGTKITYNPKTSTLQVESNATLVIQCETATIQADTTTIQSQTATIQAEDVVINSNNINLGNKGGGGIVTTECIDPFTGAPFPQGSLKARASL